MGDSEAYDEIMTTPSSTFTGKYTPPSACLKHKCITPKENLLRCTYAIEEVVETARLLPGGSF